MEAGDPGAPMDLAVVHVEQKAELDPVTVHSHNMEVKPVQDKPQRVLAVTQIPVQLMEAGDPGPPMDLAAKLVVEEQKTELDPVTVHSHNMEVKPVQDHHLKLLAVAQIPVQLMEAGDPGAPMDLA